MGQPDSKRTKQATAERRQVETAKQNLSGHSRGNGVPVGRGGPNRGQGRKPLGTEATTSVTLRMTLGQRDKLKALGGAAWVRGLIDAA